MPPKSSKKSSQSVPTKNSSDDEKEITSTVDKSATKKKFVQPKLPDEYSALKRSKDFQIIHPNDFDLDRVIYSVPKVEDIGDGLTAKRINIFYKYDDETYGSLIFDAPKCFSFGIKEILDKKTKATAGYSLSYQLRDMDGWRDDQTKFHEVFNQLYDYSVQHVFDNRVSLGKKRLWEAVGSVRSVLKNPIYYPVFPEGNPREGDVDEDKSPNLSVKLLTRKVKNSLEITTKFYDANNSDIPIDPTTLIDQRMNVEPAIIVDCLFFGSAVSYMVKCFEADVERVEFSGRKRLRPKKVVETQAKTYGDILDDDGADNEDKEKEENEYEVDQE